MSNNNGQKRSRLGEKKNKKLPVLNFIDIIMPATIITNKKQNNTTIQKGKIGAPW